MLQSQGVTVETFDVSVKASSDVPDLVETIEREVLSMVQSGEQGKQVTLHPENLGPLTLSVKNDGAGIQVDVQAASGDVQGLVQRQEGAVRELLQSQGVTVDTFDVAVDVEEPMISLRQAVAELGAAQTAALRNAPQKGSVLPQTEALEQVVEAAEGAREARSVPQTQVVSSNLPSQSMESRVSTVQDFVETMDRRILSMVQKGEQTMRLTLQPGNLGRLTLLCREDAGALQIEIQTSSSMVQGLLQRHEGAVRELLQSQGTEVGQFDVTSDGGQGRSARQQSADEEERGFGSQFGSGIETATSEEEDEGSAGIVKRTGTVSIFA